MTAALAYDATTYTSPFVGEEESAAEELAVAWAVVRSAQAAPAEVADRRALQAAEAEILSLAQSLGLDEGGLKALLQVRIERDGPPLSERACRDDAPA